MIPLQSLRASGQESSAGRRTSPAVESMGSAWFPWKQEHRELPLWHLGNADVALRSGWGNFSAGGDCPGNTCWWDRVQMKE